jgi:hypothetical protein
MEPSQGRGLGRRMIGRRGAGGDVFAAFLGRHNVPDAADDRMAEAFGHQRDFDVERIAGHRRNASMRGVTAALRQEYSCRSNSSAAAVKFMVAVFSRTARRNLDPRASASRRLTLTATAGVVGAVLLVGGGGLSLCGGRGRLSVLDNRCATGGSRCQSSVG